MFLFHYSIIILLQTPDDKSLWLWNPRVVWTCARATSRAISRNLNLSLENCKFSSWKGCMKFKYGLGWEIPAILYTQPKFADLRRLAWEPIRLGERRIFILRLFLNKAKQELRLRCLVPRSIGLEHFINFWIVDSFYLKIDSKFDSKNRKSIHIWPK